MNSLATVSAGFSEYEQAKSDLIEFFNLVDGRFKQALSYLQTAAKVNRTSDIFDLEAGMKALDAAFWDNALKRSKVLECMSYDRRSEWFDQIRSLKTPEFIKEDVLATIRKAQDERPLYLSERIDTAFKMLSPNHVTNSKWGFSDRMIIKDVVDQFKTTNSNKTGKIDDLRTIMGAMINRNTLEQPITNTGYIIKKILKNVGTGTWVTIDNGLLRIKLFKKGTMHLEINPAIACRLNELLALARPNQIPNESFKPKKNPAFKEPPADSWLSPEVMNELTDIRIYKNKDKPTYGLHFSICRPSKGIEDLKDICRKIGAISIDRFSAEFEYDPTRVMELISIQGRVPDWKDHQYYPTQDELADYCEIELDVQENDICLEPSAGQAHLAKRLNNNTTLIEWAALNCEILKAKGFSNVIEADFIKWASKHEGKVWFDKILMNPPYSDNQALNHVIAAGNLLAGTGKLVAILPSTFKNREILGDQFRHDWSDTFHNQFEGTMVSVAVVTIVRK